MASDTPKGTSSRMSLAELSEFVKVKKLKLQQQHEPCDGFSAQLGRDMNELHREEDDQPTLNMLFDDGLPVHDDNTGYRGNEAAKAAGISYRQLDYWARTELVVPTVRDASGSGSQRLYSFRDILVLKLVKRLLDTGISLQQIRTAVEQLRAAGIYDLAQTTLMSDGASVYLCTTNDEVIDLVSRGQGVFGIAIGKVLREVENSLVELETFTVDAQDELAARRARKAV